MTIAITPKKGKATAVSRKPTVAERKWSCPSWPIYRGKMRLPEPKNIEKRAKPIKRKEDFFFIADPFKFLEGDEILLR